MTTDTAALPPIDAITRPWWDATREHRLTIQRCVQCGHLQHYPRAICLHCMSGDLDFVEVSGRGTLDSFTVVERALPGFTAPYVVARVRLDEGPTLLTRIESPIDTLACDARVIVGWRDLADGRALPVFTVDRS
jgi:uncharacterized protein